MEALAEKINQTENKISAIEFLLSGGRVGEENGFVALYQGFKKEELQGYLRELQAKENMLLVQQQQQQAAAQPPGATLTSALIPSYNRTPVTIRAIFESKVSGDDEMATKMSKPNFLSLELPDGIFARRYGIIPRIYIRQCYEELYDINVTKMLNPEIKWSITLFTGVPGIGKSVFLLYFLYRFINDDNFRGHPFALEFEKGQYYYFEWTSNPGKFLCSKISDDNLPIDQTLLLSDIKETEEPACYSKWGYIFSSPNQARYKETMKSSLSYTYTMPTWSEEELTNLDSNRTNWYDRFVKFGGVPRHVIWDKKGKDPDNLLQRALEAKGATIAEYFFRYGHGGIDPTKCYMLVHINPRWDQSQNQWIYHGPKVHSFASDYIFQRMIEKEHHTILAEARNIFNAGVASETFGAVSAGNLFEKVCLWLKPLSGTIRANPLEDGDAQLEIQIPTIEYILPQSLKDYSKKHLEELLKSDVFYKPRISNLTSGDAFFVINDSKTAGDLILVIIQITVAVAHPIKVHGLEEILDAFSKEVKDHITRMVFLFVTPLHGQLEAKQNLTTLGGTTRQGQTIPTVLRDMRQYIFRYQL